MYELGDYIVYGNNGVCQVIEIGALGIQGIDKEKEYYTLQPVYEKGSILYTPVDNDKVVMRRVASEEAARDLIDDIPNIPMFKVENDKLREEKFKESMKKYDCREWVRMIKTLTYRKKERLSQGRKTTSSDDRYMRIAEECLYGELSIALGIPKDKVESFIQPEDNDQI